MEEKNIVGMCTGDEDTEDVRTFTEEEFQCLYEGVKKLVQMIDEFEDTVRGKTTVREEKKEMMREKLKERIAKITEEKRNASIEELCRSIAVEPAILEYLYIVVGNAVDKGCQIIYSKTMDEFHKRFDKFFEKGTADTEIFAEDYEEVYDYILQNILPIAAKESETMYHNSITDIKNLLTETISKIIVTENDTDNYSELINKCVDHIVNRLVEVLNSSGRIRATDYDLLYRTIHSASSCIFDLVYTDYHDEKVS